MHGTAANVRGPACPYFSRPMTQVHDPPNFQAVAARRADATRMYDIDCSGRRVLLTGLRCASFRPRASVHAGQLQEHVLDPHRCSIGCPGRSGHASPWRQSLHSANPTEALSSCACAGSVCPSRLGVGPGAPSSCLGTRSQCRHTAAGPCAWPSPRGVRTGTSSNHGRSVWSTE